jgi:hypothetical protein
MAVWLLSWCNITPTARVSEWVSHPHSIGDRNGWRTYFAVQTCWISFKKCAVASYCASWACASNITTAKSTYTRANGKEKDLNRIVLVVSTWFEKKEIPHTAKKDVAVTKFALKQHVYVYCTTRPTDANTSPRDTTNTNRQHNKEQEE